MQQVINNQPEISTGVEANLENQKTGIESTPIAESVNTSVPVSTDPADDVNVSATPVSAVEISDNVSKEEIEDLSDSSIEKADVDWIGRVEDVIRKDKNDPFKEEVDAEKLNAAYMQERFNVDVDASPEEK